MSNYNSYYDMMVNRTNQNFNEFISIKDIENKNIKLNTDRINNITELKKTISKENNVINDCDIEKFKSLKQEAEDNFKIIAKLLSKNREIVRDIKYLGSDLNEDNIPHALLKFIGFVESKGYRYKDIIGRSRHEELTRIRVCIVMQLRNEEYSFTKIGRMFNRHHSTIIHFSKFDFNYDKKLSELFTEMIGYLNNNN